MVEEVEVVQQVDPIPAVKEERARLEQLLRHRVAREEELGARFCDPGHLLNEASAILKAVALIESKQMPGSEALLAMANRAVADRLEAPPLASMISVAAAPGDAGPYIRRISAATKCLLMVAAPSDLDLPAPHLRDQVRLIMTNEKSKMEKNVCNDATPHLYNGLRRVRLLPGKPIPLEYRDIPMISCKCSEKGLLATRHSLDPNGNALEGEYSIARGIFAGSVTGGRPLGTVGQLPSGPGAAQNAVTAEPKEAAPTDPAAVVGNVGTKPSPQEATPTTDVQHCSGPPAAERANTPDADEGETTTEVRVFTLAGFIPELWPGFDIQGAKAGVLKMIRCLDGMINEEDEWVSNTTHVINIIPGPEFGMSEKAMAGIAAGRWVVTKGYVEASYKRKVWLDNERDHLAAPESQVLMCRLRMNALGTSGLMFYGMKAAVIMEDKRKAGVFERVIKAGGGSVVETTGLPELAHMYPLGLTHVLMEPWVGQDDPPGLQELEEATRMIGVHLCDYKILFHRVRGASAKEEDWHIRGPRAKLNAEDQEAGRRGEPDRGEMLRKARFVEVATLPVPTTSQRNRGAPDQIAPKTKGAIPKLRFRSETKTSQENQKHEDVIPGGGTEARRPDPQPELAMNEGAAGGAPMKDAADQSDEPMPPLERPGSPALGSSTTGGAEPPSGNGPETMNEGEELCVICWECIESESMCVLGCFHELHVTCAENWLRVSPRCPTCRETCDEDNAALLPPGEGRTIAFANGAVLTNQLQPDGRPPVNITVERLPGRQPNQRLDANVRGTPSIGVYQEHGFSIHPSVLRRARTCSTNQQIGRGRSTPRGSANGASQRGRARTVAGRARSTPRVRASGTSQRGRARTVAAPIASPTDGARSTHCGCSHCVSRRGRATLVNATSTDRSAVRRRNQPSDQRRNGNHHWSQQRYTRSPDGPWRRPDEMTRQEVEPMEAAQSNTEEGLRRAFVDGFTFGSVTIGVSPQERIARYNEEEARARRIRNNEEEARAMRARNLPSGRSDVIMERLSALATNAMYLLVISLMLLLIPRASAEPDMIQAIKVDRQEDPSVITSFRAGDVLAFENNPRSMSLGMTSEAVDVSILFKLKEQLWKLVQHAGSLGSNNLVSRSSCEHFCQPMGYATKMTEVLKKDLKMPHYVFTRESHNRPEKTYFVLLLEDGNGKRYCNYSLSHSATFSLTSALDLGSPYYTESRSEKYAIYALWLVDDRGQACKDGVNVKRGEIVPEDTDYEVTVMHSHGSLWGCVDICQNINGLRETALKHPGCVLGQDCQNYTHSRCEVWSYNWIKSRCRISGLPDPARDLNTYDGYNALMANHQCRSRQQHQSTLVMVNETLHEVSRVCKYSEIQPPSSQHLYRSCPGVADSLLTDVIPLTTSLEGYVMSLKRTSGSRTKGNDSVQINLEDVKDRRGAPASGTEKSKKVQRARRSIPVTALMATLRPSLSTFLHLGQAHLSAGIGKVFLGSALPMGNLLLLTTNILTMIVTMAAGLPSVAHYDTRAQLEEARSEKYQDWALVTTPDLFTLKATNEVCNANDLLTADSIPSLLRGMHEALNRLQGPLKRIVEDANPISQEVRNHIKKEGKEYGFWSRYFEDQNLVIRYFAYKVTGGPETSVTQVSVLAGNSLSPVIQGTVIAGGARRPGTSTPSWSCIGFVKEKGDQNLPWLPKECYQSPILSTSEVYTTNFLPDAQLIRVWGQHSMGHSCPKVPPGIIRARGLLVFVIGRECQVTMDGVHIRPEDQSAKSPWTRPVVLVDRVNEYPMPRIEGELYPKQLAHAINRLTNESIHPALEGIKAETENESQARAATDQVLGLALSLAIIIVLIMALTCYKRVVVCRWIQESRNEAGNGLNCLSWQRGNGERPNANPLTDMEQAQSANN